MNGERARPVALIATLGTQPEVVTVALDLLLESGAEIGPVRVVHTVPVPETRQERAPTSLEGHGSPIDSGKPRYRTMSESLRDLRSEFAPGDKYYYYRGRRDEPRECDFKLVKITIDGQPVHDVRNEREARAVFDTVFNAVRDLKRQGYGVHLSIAGGRKTLSVYGMATAQLLFDSHDRLWHLFSSSEFESSRQMHPKHKDDAKLVPIPVLPVSTVFPGMVTLLSSRDPLTVLERKQELMAMEERRSRKEFLDGLGPTERNIVDILMRAIVDDSRALSNAEVARKLGITKSVVANQFTDIYVKLRKDLSLPAEEQVDRTILVYFLTPYYREGF